MTVIADTLKAKKRLVEAGFSDEKAEGIVAIFNEADAQIATKLDLELFRKDVKSEIEGLRSDMNSRFGEVDSRFGEVDSQFGQVGARFEKLELRLTNLILKAQLAGVGATVAILSALRLLL